MKSDHKLVYWVVGFLASWSILVEKKSRRSELALYAFPRGVDSIYEILYDHKVRLPFATPNNWMPFLRVCRLIKP